MRMETSDEALARAAASGDADAFSVLVSRHYDRVFRLCFRLMGARDQAEDLCQDICAALAAVLVVLFASLMAPAKRLWVAWIAFSLGCLAAGYLLVVLAATKEFAAAMAAGLLTVLLLTRRFRR